MSLQRHNLGYLRMAVENALVEHLALAVPGANVRAAYTTAREDYPMVIVHAERTREMNEEDYRLARYVDVAVRVKTYAEPAEGGYSNAGLLTAREAHFELVAEVTHSLAQAGIVESLNTLAVPRVSFWSLYVRGDEGAVDEPAYLTSISIEVGATPQADAEVEE